jgi:putative drug exporter of the RND superfamily
MGLAVAIDYSLFIVSRYREERRSGLVKLDAIGAAGATASRAVLFSGMTVVLALLGMLIVPNSTFRSLGAGAILVVIAAVAAALTLLPALLALLGDRIEGGRVFRRRRARPAGSGRLWAGLAAGVMRPSGHEPGGGRHGAAPARPVPVRHARRSIRRQLAARRIGI